MIQVPPLPYQGETFVRTESQCWAWEQDLTHDKESSSDFSQVTWPKLNRERWLCWNSRFLFEKACRKWCKLNSIFRYWCRNWIFRLWCRNWIFKLWCRNSKLVYRSHPFGHGLQERSKWLREIVWKESMDEDDPRIWDKNSPGMPEGWSLAVGITTSASDRQLSVRPPSWHEIELYILVFYCKYLAYMSPDMLWPDIVDILWLVEPVLKQHHGE